MAVLAPYLPRPLRAAFPALLLAAASATLTIGATQADEAPFQLQPEQIGQIFCTALSADDMAPVQGLLTPSLAEVIATAEARNAAVQAQYPEDKPPLGDGIPWQSWPDHPDRCAVTTEAQPPGTIGIRLGFGEPEADSFVDQLVLVEIDGPMGAGKLWRSDDVDYVMGGTLRSFLAEAFGP